MAVNALGSTRSWNSRSTVRIWLGTSSSSRPGKTLIFAKDDSHAEDIVRLAREVFAKGNEFCQKITYRTGFIKVAPAKNEDGAQHEPAAWKKTGELTAEELLANFRNSYHPRIAVTVDMISTGTDVKPIECVFFLRNVQSAAYFEQMKGRGVRVISPDKLRTVTPSARAKDRFIIVDAVGVCEQDKTDSRTLNRQPGKTLQQVLDYVARGGLDPEALTTLAGRLARLQHRFEDKELAELRGLAGGKPLPELARGLLQACDADAQVDAAKAQFGTAEPTPEQINAATRELARDAVTPFLKPALRRRILELQRASEQTMDRQTIDEVLAQEQQRAYAEKGKPLPKNWKAKYKEPVAVNEDGLSPLPTGWAWATLDQLASPEQRAMTDGPFGSNLKTSHYTSSGPRVIRLQNVGDGEFLEAEAHISHDHFQALKRYEAKPGDIVFASLGTSLPRSCILPDHIGPAIVKADCVRFRPSAKVSTACINHFVNAIPTRQRAKRLIHGVGRPRLSLRALRTVAIPLAPLKEQRAIANAIRYQVDGIRKAESALGDELVRATRLRQSILHRAFAGSLLPQDPADEPASKLIERITRERRTRPRSSRRSTRGKVSTAQ